MRNRRRGIKLGIAGAFCGLLVGAGLIGAAMASTAPASTIYACRSLATGALRQVPTPDACAPLVESPVQWSAQGPAGPAGPPGPAGIAGYVVVRDLLDPDLILNDTISLSVSCPAGKVAVGGGTQLHGGDAELRADVPTYAAGAVNATGWRGEGRLPDGWVDSGAIEVHAICASVV